MHLAAHRQAQPRRQHRAVYHACRQPAAVVTHEAAVQHDLHHGAASGCAPHRGAKRLRRVQRHHRRRAGVCPAGKPRHAGQRVEGVVVLLNAAGGHFCTCRAARQQRQAVTRPPSVRRRMIHALATTTARGCARKLCCRRSGVQGRATQRVPQRGPRVRRWQRHVRLQLHDHLLVVVRRHGGTHIQDAVAHQGVCACLCQCRAAQARRRAGRPPQRVHDAHALAPPPARHAHYLHQPAATLRGHGHGDALGGARAVRRGRRLVQLAGRRDGAEEVRAAL